MVAPPTSLKLGAIIRLRETDKELVITVSIISAEEDERSSCLNEIFKSLIFFCM